LLGVDCIRQLALLQIASPIIPIIGAQEQAMATAAAGGRPAKKNPLDVTKRSRYYKVTWRERTHDN
jgi:hypothetical protein